MYNSTQLVGPRMVRSKLRDGGYGRPTGYASWKTEDGDFYPRTQPVIEAIVEEFIAPAPGASSFMENYRGGTYSCALLVQKAGCVFSPHFDHRTLHDGAIITITLSGKADLTFYTKGGCRGSVYALEANSMFIMNGEERTNLQHGVVVERERHVLLFRPNNSERIRHQNKERAREHTAVFPLKRARELPNVSESPLKAKKG